jgi:hypothetical protein
MLSRLRESYRGKFLTYIPGPMEEGRPGTPTPVQIPRGVPHLRGGSRPLAGQTHPNNAQGLD